MEFQLQYQSFNECSGLISFRMDWLDLHTVQGTFKSLPLHHSSKASVLRCSAFFTVQPSHPYMTTGKTIALTRRTFLAKKCLCFLICSLGLRSFSSKEQASFNFMAAVTIHSHFLEPKKRRSVTVSIVSSSVCLEVMKPDAMILVF